MKKVLSILIAMMLVTSNAHAISWTKSWSASDDGAPFAGSDIENIQNDIDTQTPTLTGNNAMSGNNTFSGTTTFSGSVTGITGSAAHSVTRGFDVVYKNATTLTVNPGTLFHGTTSVNTTSATDLDVTDAGAAIDGVAVATANTWTYVYCDSSGNLKLYNTKPNKADTVGNTTGTLMYYYYAATTTYYRCLGAAWMNSSSQLADGYVTSYRYGEKVVQVLNYKTGSEITSTRAIPYDDSIPQITEGTQALSLAIAPTSASNKLKVDVVLNVNGPANTQVGAALFQDSTTDAIAAVNSDTNQANGCRNIAFTSYATSGTTSSTHFQVRFGNPTTAAVSMNSTTAAGGTRIYGGVSASSITITEVAS